MLILSRKIGESIVIDSHIIVKILRLDGEVVKLGIEAPSQVTVHRKEVHEEIQKNNQAAALKTGGPLPKLAATSLNLPHQNKPPENLGRE